MSDVIHTYTIETRTGEVSLYQTNCPDTAERESRNGFRVKARSQKV